MVITPDTLQYNIILGLTLFIIFLKAVLLVYLGTKIWKRRQEASFVAGDFMSGVFIMILGLMISRIFYFIFDFHYTQFNMLLYPDAPQVWFWKMGQLVAGLGQVYLVYIIDKKILGGKFKGIPALFMIVGLIILFVWPVRNLDDFGLVSGLSVFPQAPVLLLPIVFISLAIKGSGELRKTSAMMIGAILCIIIAALAVNAGLVTALNNMVGEDVDVYLYFLQSGLKTGGYLLLISASQKFQM